MKFYIIFVLGLFVFYFIDAVGYLKRIAEALEDSVYEDEDDTKESEVK